MGADIFCLAVLGMVLFKAEFPLLLFLSLRGLQKKRKIRVYKKIISGFDIVCAKKLTVNLGREKYHGHEWEDSVW